MAESAVGLAAATREEGCGWWSRTQGNKWESGAGKQVVVRRRKEDESLIPDDMVYIYQSDNWQVVYNSYSPSP
jgi:hypothetical protein